MKNDWKHTRLTAGTLAAAFLLTSGTLAAERSAQIRGGDPGEALASVETLGNVPAAAGNTAEEITAVPTQEQDAAQDTVSGADETTGPVTSGEETAGEAASESTTSCEAPATETLPSQEAAPAGSEQQAQPYIQPVSQAAEDWRLLLVNPWNKLPEDYEVELATLSNGLKVDTRIYEDLEAMLAACREAGLQPIVCSAYRTQATQERLYNNKIARLRAAGWTGDALLTEAARWVAPPGTSEHQTGLALDIVSASYQLLDDAQADTAEQQWLMEHCWEYGFILRYPEDKTEVTGIGYEPWHYRYVGRETAAAIHESGLCLEEYLQTLAAPAAAEIAEPAESVPAEKPVQSALTEAAPEGSTDTQNPEAEEALAAEETAPETNGEETIREEMALTDAQE